MQCKLCKNTIESLNNYHIKCLKKHINQEKENIENWEIIERLPNLAASINNLDGIQYLYEEGYYFDSDVYMDAYKKQNKNIIDYLIENKSKGTNKFLKYYENQINFYKAVERVLSKLTLDDIKCNILKKLYIIKENQIFEIL